MSKMIKCLILLLIFNLFANCSFDNKTGIWSGSEEEKRRISELEREKKKEVVKVYTQDSVYSKEISATENIILTTPKKKFSWQMPGLNFQNSLGNIYLPSISNNFLKKKNWKK